MPVNIEASDVTAVWRPLSPAEETIVPGLSTQAWIRLVSASPDLQANLDKDDVTEDAVKSAMTSMIVRVLKNPDSVRQLSKSYDDWSKSQTLDSSVSTGELYVNEHELALITPTPVVYESGAYSVSLWG
ncbi:hypothetical protein [Arthrobacter sp. JSM 101049]|uniref:hypothetical protein n=1 Tax=Arthrobacter sp. JSM 101049 TaxID=929097 RepID=UPI0035694732